MIGQSLIARKLVSGVVELITGDKAAAADWGEVARWIVIFGTLDLTGLIGDGLADVLMESGAELALEAAAEGTGEVVLEAATSTVSSGALVTALESLLDTAPAEGAAQLASVSEPLFGSGSRAPSLAMQVVKEFTGEMVPGFVEALREEGLEYLATVARSAAESGGDDIVAQVSQHVHSKDAVRFVSALGRSAGVKFGGGISGV